MLLPYMFLLEFAQDFPDQVHRSLLFVNKEEFTTMKNNGSFIETTVYANHHYGTKIQDIQRILDSGKHAVLTVDSLGAAIFKNSYKNALWVAVLRDREKVVREIIMRDISTDEKVTRILQIDKEFERTACADCLVNNNTTIKLSVKQV